MILTAIHQAKNQLQHMRIAANVALPAVIQNGLSNEQYKLSDKIIALNNKQYSWLSSMQCTH
jgi:hypothetical protein